MNCGGSRHDPACRRLRYRDPRQMLGARTSRSAGQLYSVWPVMRHLLYTAVNGISDSVLLPGNQHFSAALAPYNPWSEAVLSINERAAGRETCTTNELQRRPRSASGLLKPAQTPGAIHFSCAYGAGKGLWRRWPRSPTGEQHARPPSSGQAHEPRIHAKVPAPVAGTGNSAGSVYGHLLAFRNRWQHGVQLSLRAGGGGGQIGFVRGGGVGAGCGALRCHFRYRLGGHAGGTAIIVF